MLADTMTTSATERVGSSRVAYRHVRSASIPPRRARVQTTYSPAVTIHPVSANRQPTVLPTTSATATPSSTTIKIRTATVSRASVANDFTTPTQADHDPNVEYLINGRR
jgi:hypothetical protein